MNSSKKTALVTVAAISLHSIALAQSYPPANLPDRGGRLGVYSGDAYKLGQITCLNVTDTAPGSSIKNVIQPGDCIYMVQGFTFRSGAEMNSVISSGAPGTKISVNFYDKSDSFKPKTFNATLTDENVFSSTQSAPLNSQNDRFSYCDANPKKCAFAAGVMVLGIAGIAKLFGGSSSSAASEEATAKYNACLDGASSMPTEMYQEYVYRECNPLLP